MNYYLSSYKLGNETARLKRMIEQTSGSFGYIPNALDFTNADPVRRKLSTEKDMQDLRDLGAEVELLDLRQYFGKKRELKDILSKLGGVYVSGGNTFVLRQAMFLSGFDTALLAMQDRKDFVYAGYSAGVCVLAPSLKAIAITDDPSDMPYPQLHEQLWDGLSILEFVFEPHYRSDHPESASTEKEVQYCIDNKILFKALRDGEVLILDDLD